MTPVSRRRRSSDEQHRLILLCGSEATILDENDSQMLIRLMLALENDSPHKIGRTLHQCVPKGCV